LGLSILIGPLGGALLHDFSKLISDWLGENFASQKETLRQLKQRFLASEKIGPKKGLKFL